ncbi:FAD:protein FMN transferase [Lederbergia sp. NSJ-179]|uniref:FAD:protein FMN transferase n=1 Tax=Lederbergia sp. NSJ-179 TaxID=2931402 RepID=UPI001FD45CC2|nr:FAD:protein FMN transferase [Lederbergia sp. NSJ-179]MCJ7841659.1 FAD:protein FMN transferase [Lederbergia sp. NSJ-179]
MQSREIHMMGTIIQLSIQHKYANFVLDELVIQLKEYEQRFSAHDPTSELMEVNKNAGIKPVKVHPSLYELIKVGKKHSTAAGSSLNIAIGPLVQAWRIGFADAHIPSKATIQSLLSKTNASEIILDDQEQTVFLKHTGMFIDLGALAKGFIADLLIHDLKSMNVQAGLINLGGNVMTYGFSPKHEDGYWRIGIQHPFLPRGNNIAVLRAFNQSVVTSGVYERKFTTNNKTYHHILDPHTGYPIQSEIAGLTIVSKKSVDGEIWTGRLFGQSPGQIIDTLNQIEDVAGIVVTNNGKLYYSEALEPYLMESV